MSTFHIFLHPLSIAFVLTKYFSLFNTTNFENFGKNIVINLLSIDKSVNTKSEINYSWVPPERNHTSANHSDVCYSNPGPRAACSPQRFKMWPALVLVPLLCCIIKPRNLAKLNTTHILHPCAFLRRKSYT